MNPTKSLNAKEEISLQVMISFQVRTKRSRKRKNRHSLNNREQVPKIQELAHKRKVAVEVVLRVNYQIREAVEMAQPKKIKYRKNLT